MVATIPGDLPIKDESNEYINGYTKLYGFLQSVGGERPVAFIKPDGSSKGIKCPLSYTLAKRLAPKLYTRVGVEGTAQYDPHDWSIQSVTIDNILPYEDIPFSQALEELYKASPSAWSDIDNVDAYLRDLRSQRDIY